MLVDEETVCFLCDHTVPFRITSYLAVGHDGKGILLPGRALIRDLPQIVLVFTLSILAPLLVSTSRRCDMLLVRVLLFWWGG